MRQVKLWFTDFYEGFDPNDNPFLKILSELFSVELEEKAPDFLIYSCYGYDFLKYDCVRIFYTGENLRPDFNFCDYAIGFDYLHFEDRYLRYPNYALFEGQFKKLIREDKSQAAEKEFFCNFIYSNKSAHPIRDKFFHKLNEYKNIISPGSHLNNSDINIGGRFSKDWMFDKIHFQSQCKFTIAFENSSSPGYTTEKIMHAFLANSIPIYWGDPKVEQDFNSEAFINSHNFKNLDKLVERVIEVDQSRTLYNKIIQQPPFKNNKIPPDLKRDTLSTFLTGIFNKEPIEGIRRPRYGTTFNYENRLKQLFRKEKLKPWQRFFGRY